MLAFHGVTQNLKKSTSKCKRLFCPTASGGSLVVAFRLVVSQKHLGKGYRGRRLLIS